MHYKVRLRCFDAEAVDEVAVAEAGVWTPIARLNELPLSSPQRRIAATLTSASPIQTRLFD
jgi:hypothetical protein